MKTKSLPVFENNKFIFTVLVLAPLFLYLKSIFFDFTPMDEQWMIVNNAAFLESIESFKGAYTMPLLGLYYRPFFLMTIISDFHIGKLSPYIYHLSNLLWHLLSVILVYRFLLLAKVDKKPAFIYSLIFSVHPVMLHAVAWVPGRNDVMLCVFTLASLINLLKYLHDQKKKFFFLHLLFFTCALLTKENAVVLPVIFLVTCFAYRGIRNKDLYLAGSWILLSIGWFLLRRHFVTMPAASYDLVATVKNFVAGLLIFTGKVFFPIKQSVFPTLKNSSVIPGILALITMLLLYFKPGIQNKKIAALGLVIFFALLVLPVWYGATKGNGEHYEHRTYASAIGILLFLSQVKFNINSKNFLYASLIVVVLFSVRTYTRMNVYKDKISFLKEAIKDTPDYYYFQYQMANYLYSIGDYAKSIPYYNRSIELRPDKISIYVSRGTSYYSLKMYNEAIFDFTKAINGAPFNPVYYLNRCISYNKTGDVENAYKDMEVLVKCCNNDIPPDLKMDVIQKWHVINSKQ